MKTVIITYFGKEYDYPLLSAEDIGDDYIIRLFKYEFSVQGYEQCYNNTRRFHFVTTLEELAKLVDAQPKPQYNIHIQTANRSEHYEQRI